MEFLKGLLADNKFKLALAAVVSAIVAYATGFFGLGG